MLGPSPTQILLLLLLKLLLLLTTCAAPWARAPRGPTACAAGCSPPGCGGTHCRPWAWPEAICPQRQARAPPG
eukprot:scaffold5265_cov69-Phaeocystis_antarctica.AAC.1